MQRKAFTLIELITVMLVVGILYGVLAPRLSFNRLNEARDQVIQHLRYAQHLAINDDKYLGNAADSSRYTNITQQNKQVRYWFKGWWQFQIHQLSDGSSYSIYSNHASTMAGNADYGLTPDYSSNTELSDLFAKDSLTGQYIVRQIDAGSSPVPDELRFEDTDLGNKYGVSMSMNNCVFNGSSTSSDRIFFDHLGRPHCNRVNDIELNPYRYIAIQRLVISLTDGSETLNICVEPESGYIHACNI